MLRRTRAIRRIQLRCRAELLPARATLVRTEKHPSVRTFTTDVLKEPVEWTGKVRAELFVSSTAPDSDFIVRVTDVYPDGRSILIMDALRRARFRESWIAKFS